MVKEDRMKPRVGGSVGIEEHHGISFDESSNMKDIDLMDYIQN